MSVFEKLFDFDNFEKINDNILVALKNIENLNPELNAFCKIYKEEILDQSKSLQDKINKKKHGQLAGMIVGIKDLICYKNHPVQASSKILENYVSPYNSTVVERILNEDGLIIGHQNCDEFGMGSSNTKSIYGPVKNFYDKNKTSGGSSGGSAVAVQTDMCHVALGTDTGGSIRQPAAFCGIIGFKPSYGMISRYGIIAHASSFDTVGILGKKIKDIETVFKIISGQDNHDLSMCDKNFTTQEIHKNERYKIAYIDNILQYEGLQQEIKDSTNKFLEKLINDNNTVENIVFDFLEYVVPVYYTLTTAEACSNLARYDGVRYGYRTKEYVDFEDFITKNRSEGFGYEVKKRILLGNYIFKTRKENNYLEKAQYLRERIKKYMESIFEKYDFIVLPTTTTTAFALNDKNINSEKMYWSDIFTVIASIAQMPAISIPYGCDKNGMPIGIQIIANKYEDSKLLNFCSHILQ